MKRNRLIFYGLSLVVLVLIFQIIRISISQPGLDRFEGKFEELDFYRNENNTGPVLRIFAIKALDSSPDLMKAFAEAQPHTKYGKTLVFFFSEDVQGEIALTPKEPYFPEKFHAFLLAKFEKTPMGESRFELVKP